MNYFLRTKETTGESNLFFQNQEAGWKQESGLVVLFSCHR